MKRFEPAVERLERNGAPWLMGAALVVSGALTLALTWKMTFFQDTWDYLINRRDPTLDALMRPHNEHISVIPVAIEELILRLFGMATAHPEYILLTVFLLATAWLVFVYVRRRMGDWPALFAAVLILCLGPAWEVLLWPFEIGFIGSIGFGIAMFLALEREDRRGDVAACVFLAISMAFSSLGIPFAVGAIADIVQKRKRLGLNRAFVAAIPIFLYALWYVGWGSEAEAHFTLRNLMAAPRFVIESLAVDLGSLFGLGTSPINASTDPAWGRVLLIAAAIGLVLWKRRRPGWFSELWPVAIAAAANWFLTAFNMIPGRDPTSSRYQYAGAIFIVLILANLLQGERFGRRAIAIGALVTLLAIGPNLVVLKDNKNTLQEQTAFTKGDLAALEIARRTVPPEFELLAPVAGTVSLANVYAGSYLEAVEEYGSPAYTQAELAAAAPQARRAADVILSQALPLSTAITPGGYQQSGATENCVAVPPLASPESEVRIDPGATTIEVSPGPEAKLSLRRFAEGEFPVALANAPGGSAMRLRVPRDESPRPWYLHIEAEQAARVCR